MSFTVDLARLRAGDWIAAAGGVGLIVSLFFDWYGFGGGIASDLTGDVGGLTGWDVLTDLPGFIVILAAIVAIKFAGLAALGLRVNWGLRDAVLTLAIGSLAVLIVLWRMATQVGGSLGDFDFSLKVGIFLGLASTLAITAGAWLALRDDGVDVLVPVGGRRTTGARKRS